MYIFSFPFYVLIKKTCNEGLRLKPNKYCFLNLIKFLFAQIQDFLFILLLLIITKLKFKTCLKKKVKKKTDFHFTAPKNANWCVLTMVKFKGP